MFVYNINTFSVTLVFRPMRMPENPIICLFILYKPEIVLYMLAFLWNKASFYVSVLCIRAV